MSRIDKDRTVASEPARVDSGWITRALEEIVELRRLERPYTLYRHVAAEAGVHPTTILRYRNGYLATADGGVHACVRRFLEDARRGRPLGFEVPGRSGRGGQRLAPAARVPSSLVRDGMEAVLRSLDLDEHQFLCRYLADEVGLHATTVLRYYRCELKTAPWILLAQVEKLREKIANGEAVPFRRSAMGAPVVVREQTQKILAQLLDDRDPDERTELISGLEHRLNLRRGTVQRICSDPSLRFVQAHVHRAIEAIVEGVEYDPGRTYPLGQRIRHHLFGAGDVVEKVHKNKVLVEFAGGRRVLLSEAVPEDPYRYMRSAGGAPAAISAL